MPSARWFSRWSSALLVMLVAVATCAVTGRAFAQAPSNSYTVNGVDVDVTGADAIQARQQGIRQAQQKAVKLLIERMVAPPDGGHRAEKSRTVRVNTGASRVPTGNHTGTGDPA